VHVSAKIREWICAFCSHARARAHAGNHEAMNERVQRKIPTQLHSISFPSTIKYTSIY